METTMAVSPAILQLYEAILEGLFRNRVARFQEEFREAALGKGDFSLVPSRFAAEVLCDPQEGVIRHADQDSVEHVGHLCRQQAAGNKVSNRRWRLAVRRADRAFRSAQSVSAATWAANAALRAANAGLHPESKDDGMVGMIRCAGKAAAAAGRSEMLALEKMGTMLIRLMREAQGPAVSVEAIQIHRGPQRQLAQFA